MGIGRLESLEERLTHKSAEVTDKEVEELTRQNAATRIQRAWRAKRRASYLGTDFLWTDLATHARFKVDRDAAIEGKNTARERWRRAIFLALRLQDGNQMLADNRVEDADVARKYLETQHWLELIDGKHRYGANLKYYHRRWQQEKTTENFFRWLDQGGGRELSLKECPRDQLEKERISYLSPSQRLNYLVQIDSEGKLRWAKNGEFVDTTSGHWKDAGNGGGIVALERPEQIVSERRTSFDVPPSSPHVLVPDQNVPDEQLHYYLGPRGNRPPTAGSRIKRWMWRNLTPRGLMERLLRKTLQRNTWIYVSDKHFNIFIGIKTPGTFQHSSFLGGGLVTSAGLITVKEGVVHKLSPLSGHYRTSIQHFRHFLSEIEERGVDMHKVEISKAEAALWGIEHLARFRKKQAKVVNAGKHKMENAVSNVRHTFSKSDEDDEAWKKEVLQGRKTHPTSNDGVQQYADERQNGGTSGVAHSTGSSVPLEQTDFPAQNSGADLQPGGG